MKTRSLIAILFILLAITYCSRAATVIVKISQFPNTTAPAGSDLFLLASGATNKNITWNQLKDAIGTNPATVTILNNLYVSNAFVTNLTVLNEYKGKTTFTTNLYVDYTTNNYSYITNLYVSTNYANYSYTTNLFLVNTVTNYYLFSTNIYQEYPTYVNNSYVSNYFQTNVWNNSYVSNYFNTNQYLYLTNIYHYSTNLTVTNFYQNDMYVSNYFNTNIFFVDNTVSNFFATNIYNTINISSNYTYQVSQNLTNPVFYGHGFFMDYEGDPNPSLQIAGPTSSIYLNGADGNVGASTFTGDSFYQLSWNWDGPTNVVDTYTSDQYFIASTDCEITGLDKVQPAGYSWGGVLTITNAAATNITLRFPASIIIPERTTSVVISNASQGMISLRYNPQAGTNGVYRNF